MIAWFKLVTYKCDGALTDCAYDPIWVDDFQASQLSASCPAGEYYTDEKCVPICGDGVKTANEVCDFAFSPTFATTVLRNVFVCD